MLLSTHEIQFDLYDQSDKYIFINMYLKKTLSKDNKVNYILYVLGKGGEPKKDVAINLTFTNKYV